MANICLAYIGVAFRPNEMRQSQGIAVDTTTADFFSIAATTTVEKGDAFSVP